MNADVESILEIHGVPLLSVLEEADTVWGLPVRKVAHSFFFSF